MPRNNPRQAVDRYLEPFRAALGCIAHGTLVTTDERHYVVDRVYSLVVNETDPLALRTNPYIALSAGQWFRVVQDDAIGYGPFRVHTVGYFYAFSTDAEQEVLNFQWTPEATQPGQKRFPHVHVGRGLLGGNAQLFPETFHKKHIPTGRVSFESIIRFAIEELDVPPLRDDWSTVLERGQAEFDRYRRRSPL